ncbi:MAG: DUF1648 domain-containing protein [bacterium]|nr:DUF1648 domain-containing protein [bacterium]
MSKKLSNYYPVWLEFVFLFLIFCSFYLVVTTYPDLPKKVPTHFGPSGKPDAWGPKSHILVIPFVQIGLYTLMTVATSFMVKSSTPIRFVNLPISKARVQSLDVHSIESIRRVVIRNIFSLKAVIIAMFTYLIYATIQVATGNWKGLGWGIGLFIALALIIAGVMTLNIYRIIREVESKSKSY